MSIADYERSYTAIESVTYKRSITFACGSCNRIEKVDIDKEPEAGETPIDKLPEGWTYMRTPSNWRFPELIICDRHELTVGRAKQENKK